jgi:alpha amylase-like protein
MRLPDGPTICELNTAVWLGDRTLADISTAEWDALAALPVDAVWLMGVWQRSPAGLEIALTDPSLEAGNRAALPDLVPADVIGSPYCVRDYVVDERFGGPEALMAARRQLSDRGLGLILDYVPNHVAPDHPWLADRPDCFIHGSEDDDPAAFLQTAAGLVARGRDPYFPPWPDVVQLNAFAPALRDAVAELLLGVGHQCDGLRCDMAMLMTNEVFARTWGERAGPAPTEEFWPQLIGRVKAVHPDLTFIAEAYWDMEWTLQQQGFDYCYDKRLYDRLVHEGPASVRSHLQADGAYQERLVRFVENHDEPRAAATFPPEKARAAAVVMSTVKGARLYHDGQFEGRRTHIPVFMRRGPQEPPDTELRAFYERLLHAVAGSGLRHGDWRLCDTTGWPDNASHEQLVAWCWDGHLVVVNLAAAPAQGRVRLPWDGLAGRRWRFTDRLTGAEFERDGDELEQSGLYVALDPWGTHLLAGPAESAADPAQRA